MNFSGNIVLVTGAAKGAGKAIAEAFLKKGAIVIAADIVKSTWGEGNDQLFHFTFDVSKEDEVRAAFNEIDQRVGIVDILVNNAGITEEAPVQETSLKTWNRIIGVNTTGAFLCIREVVKRLLDNNRKGSIINISSIAGKNAPFPGSIAYCASKAAMIGMTRNLAVELGPKDIRVNAICPGSINTSMIQEIVKLNAIKSNKTYEEMEMQMTATIPLKRFQQPEDVANLVLFLASELACNINGESINLDGGVVRD